MSFLAPWFLLGALAVCGPVLFHLIRRSARERVPFSSLLFLRPTPPRATRRHKLEHIVLLVLRCLAVLLLAAGFARPFFRSSKASPPVLGAGRQTLLLLDTSASMRREGLWAKARAVAERYFDRAAPADRVAVMTFDTQARTLISFSDWSAWAPGERGALARQRLAAISPSWGGTQLGAALTTAAERFAEESRRDDVAGIRELTLISDLQEGAKLDGLQGHDWPKGVRVIIERVEPKRRGNAGLEILDASGAGMGNAGGPRVRVVNAHDSGFERLRLAWLPESGSGPVGKAAEIYVPPGQTRTVPAPELPAGTTSGALRLSGDEEEFDNTAYFAAPEVEHISIAYFGSESANDPEHMLYYLQRAFPPATRRQVEVVCPMPNGLFSLATLSHAALAVIPTALAPNESKAVQEWMAGGKTALLVLSNVQSAGTLAALAGTADIDVTEASGEYALLGDIDFTHPIFAPFGEPQFSDFSHIHFWKHRRWAMPENIRGRALAKFDDGSAALAQIPVGKGNLLVLGAGWHPAESQLAVSTKFLPLMQIILDWSGGAAPARSQFQIGEAIPSPGGAGDSLTWRKPNGKVVALGGSAAFTDTDLPGIYTATDGSKVRRFAVNVPLDESRTAALSADDLARLGVPLTSTVVAAAATSPSAQHQVQLEVLENRQKLWRWAIVGILAIALVEIGLAGWLSRRVSNVRVTP